MLRPDVWQCSIYFIQRKCVNTVQTKKTLGANVSPKLRKTNNRTLMSTIPVQQFLVLVGLMLTLCLMDIKKPSILGADACPQPKQTNKNTLLSISTLHH